MRFLLLCLFLKISSVHAQFHSEKLLRPQLMTQYENRFTQDYKQSDQNLSLVKYYMGFSYPIINRINKATAQGTFKFTALTLFAQAGRNDMNDDLLGDKRKLYQTQAGFDFVFIPGNRFYYQLTGKAHRLYDNKKPKITTKYTGLALVHFLLKPLTIHGGAARTMVKGKMLLTPVAGLSLYWKPEWHLYVLYPYAAQISKSINPKMGLTLFAKSDGMQYDISNEAQLANAGGTISLEQIVYMSGLQFHIDFDDNWLWFADGGVLFNSSHAYTFNNNTLADANLTNAWFAKAGIAYRFGQKVRYGKNHGANFILDYDVTYTHFN